jgi:hypothetical protein
MHLPPIAFILFTSLAIVTAVPVRAPQEVYDLSEEYAKKDALLRTKAKKLTTQFGEAPDSHPDLSPHHANLSRTQAQLNATAFRHARDHRDHKTVKTLPRDKNNKKKPGTRAQVEQFYRDRIATHTEKLAGYKKVAEESENVYGKSGRNLAHYTGAKAKATMARVGMTIQQEHIDYHTGKLNELVRVFLYSSHDLRPDCVSQLHPEDKQDKKLPVLAPRPQPASFGGEASGSLPPPSFPPSFSPPPAFPLSPTINTAPLQENKRTTTPPTPPGRERRRHPKGSGATAVIGEGDVSGTDDDEDEGDSHWKHFINWDKVSGKICTIDKLLNPPQTQKQ